MQGKNEMLVVHPVFGKIRIEGKFERVLELKPFRDLAYKSQLGTKIFSSKLLNSRHTRLMHSIGVMYLTERLLNICDEKFNKYFSITVQDKETLCLAALGHDLGHIAFSHSLEDKSMKTHEQRTIEYFERYSDEMNEIFEYDIVSKVIQIYKDNDETKNQKDFLDTDNLDMLFIFKSLLIGAIDCDRMEYITTDRFNVFGERVNYQDIFKYITIVLLNGSPTVGFEKEAVPMIEDMLFTRFNQYLQIYYDDESTLTEMILKEYKKIEEWDEEETVSKTEYEILTEFKMILSDNEEQGSVRYRLAEIILDGNREDIMFKRFENDEEYKYFLKRLKSITKRKDIIKTANKRATLYNPLKNKVYIKDDDGVIKDLMEVSYKIREISVNCNYIMVDLNAVYEIDPEEVKNIKALFLDNPVEIEKKFVSWRKETKENWCKKVEEILKSIPNIQIKDFDEWEKIQNEDLYFDILNNVPAGVAMRYRVTQNEKAYYIKTPADDGTSITKRHENKYPCQNREEFLELATSLFESAGYNCGKVEVTEGVKISTERYKTVAQVQDSKVEIACDFSRYEYAGNVKYGMMIECECIKGEDISLWYVSKHLREQGFIETNESKETRAKKALRIK